MDEERRLANPQLFAAWAGEEAASWEQAIGMSVTHLSRGQGRIVEVSQTGGVIAIHVQYARTIHDHALWEFRTEVREMTLPPGCTRAGLAPAARARRLLLDEGRRERHEAALPAVRQKKR